MADMGRLPVPNPNDYVNVSTTPIADAEYIVQDSLYQGNYEPTFCKNCNEWVRVLWTTVTRCPLCGKEILKW